jgi:molybdopterin-guanine dinucleotide biosynthesis protein A
LCNTIVLNANDEKLEKFAFRKVKDRFYDIGPISGIYSSLYESETENNLIVNCDMPFISTELLKFILDNSKGFDIVLPENNGQVQSLTGYFKKSIVPHILKEIELNHYKPVKMFKEMNLNIVQIKESQHFYRPYLFMNINSIEEYNEAIGIFNKIST